MLGSYNINVQVGKLPQKIATAFPRIFGDLLGATYVPLAYLGSKIVSGTNHAVLATQTLLTGSDVHNIVVIVFNEKPGADPTADNIRVVEIRSVVSDGGKLGGLSVAPVFEIPAEAQEAFDKNFQGFLGNKVTPFALLATQMVNGAKYIFAAETQLIVSPAAMAKGNTHSVSLVTVYSNYDQLEITPIITGTAPAGNLLGASAGNLASPLGEWP